jgi:hypothetical protein
MAKKLKEINTEPSEDMNAPTEITVYARDDTGALKVIGTIDWMNDHWEASVTESEEWIDEMLNDGAFWGGKVYTAKDRDFYIPLVNSNYTAYAFKGE